MNSSFHHQENIFTDPYKNFQSQEESPEQTSYFFLKNQHSKQDCKDSIKLANLIGFSSYPVNNIRRRIRSQMSNIPISHHLNYEKSSKKPELVIKNDLSNRKVNFFDLRKIMEEKKKRDKIQSSKDILENNFKILENQIERKEQRIKSAKLFRTFDSILNFKISKVEEKDQIIQKQRIKTARQIRRRQELSKQKDIEIEQHVGIIKKQISIRSNILKDTFECSLLMNQEFSDKLYYQESKQKSKITKTNKNLSRKDETKSQLESKREKISKIRGNQLQITFANFRERNLSLNQQRKITFRSLAQNQFIDQSAFRQQGQKYRQQPSHFQNKRYGFRLRSKRQTNKNSVK